MKHTKFNKSISINILSNLDGIFETFETLFSDILSKICIFIYLFEILCFKMFHLCFIYVSFCPIMFHFTEQKSLNNKMGLSIQHKLLFISTLRTLDGTFGTFGTVFQIFLLLCLFFHIFSSFFKSHFVPFSLFQSQFVPFSFIIIIIISIKCYSYLLLKNISILILFLSVISVFSVVKNLLHLFQSEKFVKIGG